MTTKIDAIDRINSLSKEILGLSRILLILEEYLLRDGIDAEHLMLLGLEAERCADELKTIAADLESI